MAEKLRPNWIAFVLLCSVSAVFSLPLLYFFVIPPVASWLEGGSLSRSEWSTIVSLSIAFIAIPVWAISRFLLKSRVVAGESEISTWGFFRRRALNWSSVEQVGVTPEKLTLRGGNRELVVDLHLIGNPDRLLEIVRERVPTGAKQGDPPSQEKQS